MTKTHAKEHIVDYLQFNELILHINISEKYKEIECITLSANKLIWLYVYKYDDNHITFKDSKLLEILH